MEITRIRTVSLTLAAVAVTGMTGAALAGGDSHNVDLLSHVTLGEMGTAGATDCWGYVSPSGREYAIMGNLDKTSIIEITDPQNPVIVGEVSHQFSLADAKVFGEYVYVSNGSGGGIDIIDLSNVDDGTVRLVQRMTTGGVQESHNIAINEQSGYLYLAIGNINNGALVAFNLADPENPVIDGMYDGDRSHDLHVISYTEGPYAGREIAFSFSEGRGMDIIDVTDKSNMFLLSRSTYDGLAYCHQGWVSDDRQFVYLNDELDGQQRTTVFDIQDLENPVLLGHFSGSEFATDHNLYIRDGFVFAANYTSGVRIFDLNQDPVSPPEVGWYDTSSGTGKGFSGAWTAYPFFPSGVVIVSDRENGLFVLDPGDAVGQPVTAALTNFTVETGVLLAGDLGDLAASDDNAVRTRSGFGATFADLHNMEMSILAEAPGQNPTAIDVVIESHIDEPAGTVQVRMKNFDTTEFDVIGTYAIGDTDAVEQIVGIDGGTYYNPNNGRVRMKIKHVVVVPFFAFTFESFLDHVEITLR